MQQQISLSIFNHGGDGGSGKYIQPLLNAFERQHKIHVDLEVLNWQTGWSRLVEISIYGRGPDLSEVGSTWVMDLARMNALQSFSASDIKILGSENDFVQANWKAGIASGTDNLHPIIWGIPRSVDVRLVFYRRDFLERARVDPSQAFNHIEALDHTIAALKTHGFELPLSLTTLRSSMNIHQMASWVWDSGGDFMMPDGKSVAFDEPKALRGMHYYFGLGRYLPSNRYDITEDTLDPLFFAGDSGMLFGGAWVVANPRINALHDKIGLSPLPGGSFVGGTHMVMWKHSYKKEAALLLLDFLTKHSAEHKVFPMLSLPAYLPDWATTPFIEEPYFSAFRNALSTGRSFPTTDLWGLVEKRLANIIPSIWEKALAPEKPDLNQVLSETVVPLARMINISLNQ